MVSNQVTTRSISRSALLISLVAAGCRPGPATSQLGTNQADLILVGGDVRTMNVARAGAPTAIAMKGGTIVAVGTDAEIRALGGKATRVIDLGGKTVTPGLVDAHCHLYGLGSDLESVNVRAQATEADAAAIAISAAKARPAGEWVLGRGWDQNRWPGQKFPTRASLDAVTDRPIVLRRIDGHAIWVNGAALAAAKITAATPDPAGGKIVRGDDGEPTGVLVDNAIGLVAVPEASAETIERRIRAAAAQAISVGLTGVHEMGIDAATADVYRKLARARQLPLRVYAFLAGDPTDLAQVRAAPIPAEGRFVMRGVKYFADGALGSRGARLAAPYDDDPQNLGLWVTEPRQLAAAVDAAVASNWQVAIHAIGDAAIGSVLDAYEAAARNHPGDHRPRVEHLQVVAPADFARLKAVGAIASMQPTHATSDMPWAEARLGAARIQGAYAWRTVLDLGIPLASGSDFPVEGVSPMLGIYAAVTRQDEAGTPAGGWYPAQRMTLEEAIAAFTRGSAYAEGAEALRGAIRPGRDADVTVFDRKLGAPDRSLLDAKIAYTIVGGTVVFERP
ncbi:MAG: amidohydrolase family protein [Deltaproteobacteria bacterium]|nr:amidohydrolase family protein [Deltaproteobacteria bacterium]